jgi:hypothetical protein
MEVRLRVCPVCQGAWFRKAGFDRYEPWQRWHLVAASAHKMSLLVCLCGRPQLPNLSGVRPPIEDRETASLLERIRGARELATGRAFPGPATRSALPAARLPKRRRIWRDGHAKSRSLRCHALSRFLSLFSYKLSYGRED